MLNRAYNEDFFAETRMSFGDHLDDLRSHLLKAFKWFIVGMIAAFFIGDSVVIFISEPVTEALSNYHVEYYKKNGDKENRLVRKFHEEIKREREKGKNANPNIMALAEPQTLVMQFSKREQFERMKRDFPELFRKGGALEGKEAPPEDALEEMQVRINTEEFMEKFQAPMMIVAKRTVLTSLTPQETFMVYFKVCMITGFVISSPLVFYHLWTFVAAGLYPHEKRLVNVYMPLSIFLFLGGVALCQFLIIPAALKALLGFNLWLNVEPDFRLNEWLSFAIWMPVIVGLCFQTPLIMFVLGKLGIFTVADFRSKRKVCIFVMLIFAAVVSPSVDPGSLLLMWVPMVFLYELGIWMVIWMVPPPLEDSEVPYEPGMEAGVSSNGELRSDTPRE